MTRGLNRRQILKAGLVVAGGVAASPLLASGVDAADLLAAAQAAPGGPLPWPAANAILASTALPTFKGANFVVTDAAFGARGDGHTDNTAAFQKAIARAPCSTSTAPPATTPWC